MHVIGTAGHVDHGKSTLVQRLTGIDPDRFAEEKRRGLTIDLGFAWFTLPSGNEIGIVDVPGHERFVRNMLAGAGGITACIFVVAANEGWKPQSAEHLAILDLLGIGHGVVALTKADTVEPDALDGAQADVRARLRGTSLEGAAIVPCSARTGEGIDALVTALDAAVQAAPPPVDRGRPRLWVDRVFTIAGAGTVVTGTSAGGSFAVGDHVEIAPEGRTARIRAIQSHKRDVDQIGPGHRAALNLAGLERQGAERGNAIVRPGSWVAARTVDVKLRVLEDVSNEDAGLTGKGAWVMHVGSAETPVRLKILGGDRIEPAAAGYAQLHLAHPLPLARGDRFVLRDVGRIRTVAGGSVLDPIAASTSRTDQERIELLGILASGDDPAAARALAARPGRVRVADLQVAYGIDPVEGGVRSIAGIAIAEQDLDALIAAAEALVAGHHAAHPLEQGMPLETLRAGLDVDPHLFDAVVSSGPTLQREGDVVSLSTHAVRLTEEEVAARRELLDRLEAAGFEPPLTTELNVDPALLRALVDEGELVRVGSFHLTKASAERAKAEVADLIREADGATVAQIRDRLGTTRKYAVPLSEWLDAQGVTRRKGDLRILGPRAPG